MFKPFHCWTCFFLLCFIALLEQIKRKSNDANIIKKIEHFSGTLEIFKVDENVLIYIRISETVDVLFSMMARSAILEFIFSVTG